VVASAEVPAAKSVKVASVCGAGNTPSIFRSVSGSSADNGSVAGNCREPVPEAKGGPCCHNWTATNPFTASITSAKWLTSPLNIEEADWGSKRRVLYTTVCLRGSGINYAPGDSIGLCIPNPQPLVQEIFERIKGMYGEQSAECSCSLSSVLDPSLFSGSKYLDCENGISLGEFLTYRFAFAFRC
jgi:sulfite reductase alpha subunit-like flavoprotein